MRLFGAKMPMMHNIEEINGTFYLRERSDTWTIRNLFTRSDDRMNILKRCGLILAAITFSINAWATDLKTEEQKLGYIIGMDIGKSLRDQGTDVDLDALVEAIRDTYNGKELATERAYHCHDSG